MLVTRSKHLQSGDAKVRIHGHWLDRLEVLPVPFRNAETQVGQGEDGSSAEEGDSSFDDLAESTAGAVLTERW
jgi:hypothetical protein